MINLIYTIIKWIYLFCFNVSICGLLLASGSTVYQVKDKHPELYEFQKEYRKIHDTDWNEVIVNLFISLFICICPIIHIVITKIIICEWTSLRDNMVDKTVKTITENKLKEERKNSYKNPFNS